MRLFGKCLLFQGEEFRGQPQSEYKSRIVRSNEKSVGVRKVVIYMAGSQTPK